jgi:hypothetical protein
MPGDMFPSSYANLEEHNMYIGIGTLVVIIVLVLLLS